ncbi:molybdopterin-synthase adenylyltransferase MoeB [Fulvivirgaceae bacterium PWU4]|uniref:Molybdopterin-synthase adenylyltransferase n=1 Tax=Chryseosolibacter histidini TaxID=2782349 RepID=A0AAP2DPY7_9BACT|nr:molybdopterin-synthase adenylyltransferase MoeB [Chryseosolibacter histidini]MBT1700331.1 molybdopterin-synthase adenylyltransferase MoeB [Chryseosolibacter histidini]
MVQQTFTLDREELARYSRHIIIPEFGMEAQLKLKASRVLVIGCGGLGSPLLYYLAAAGVGTIGIVDFDVVDESNLQRQILFSTEDVGKSKAEVARRKLSLLNPYIQLVAHPVQLSTANAMTLLGDYDVIADGTDNFATRYLVNDACVLRGKPNVYASIFQFEGQVSVFNHLDENGERGPNYRDLFAEPPPPGLVPSCAAGGVLGVLPGIIGSLQALEVIKIITGTGKPLSGRLFTFDALTFETRTFEVKRDRANPLNGEHPTQNALVNYDVFCNGAAAANDIREISVHELAAWRLQGEDFQLIDVREPHEFNIVNLGAQLIPVQNILEHADKIDRSKKVVLHCKSGGRSAKAVSTLQNQLGFTNLYNLKGGILAYANEIDPSLPKY